MNIDEIIVEAFKEEFEERVEQCARDKKEHRFSLSYRLWERKMLRDIDRGRVNSRYTVKRARVAVVSFITAAFVLVGVTVYAAVSFGRFSLDTKPEYSKLFIKNLYSDKTSIEEYYELPEEDGWKINEKYVSDILVLINYDNEEKNVIFSQRVISHYNGNVDTENAAVEPISLFKDNDGIFIKHQSGSCSLYWIYDGYLFDIGGDIDKNEAINLAYSTKIKKQ